MHLILDFGNTRTKYFVFEKGYCIANHTFDNLQQGANYIKKSFPKLTQGVFVDVTDTHSEASLKKTFDKIEFKNLKSLKLPFTTLYQTPETLGADRIALVAAAVKKFPNRHCLIIDAGSCITYDLITEQHHYLGGAISPGITMRFKSLHHFTKKLPLLDTIEPNSQVWGESTHDSIQKGVTQGVLFEIEGQIQNYNNFFSPLTIILTGGDLQLLSKSLKNTIFAQPNFLAEGLDYLLDYNKN